MSRLIQALTVVTSRNETIAPTLETPREPKRETPLRHEKSRPLPFLKLLEDAPAPAAAAPSHEKLEGADAINVLLRHVTGDKTVGALLRASAESPETRNEIAEAAASLLFTGFETVYIANEDALRARLNACVDE